MYQEKIEAIKAAIAAADAHTPDQLEAYRMESVSYTHLTLPTNREV